MDQALLGLQEHDIETIFPVLYKLRETSSGMSVRKQGALLTEPSPSSHFFLKMHHHEFIYTSLIRTMMSMS